MGQVAWREAGARLCLTVVLFGLAVLKLASGHDPGFTTSASAYWVLAVLELVLAMVVLTRRWRLAAWVTIALAGGALMRGLWMGPEEGPCGCAGSVDLAGGRTPVVLAAVLGMLSAVSLMTAGARARRL